MLQDKYVIGKITILLPLVKLIIVMIDAVHYRTNTSTSLSSSDLRENFRKSPLSLAVKEGESAVFECEPPKGYPTPVVTWMLDGRDLILPRHRYVR